MSVVGAAMHAFRAAAEHAVANVEPCPCAGEGPREHGVVALDEEAQDAVARAYGAFVASVEGFDLEVARKAGEGAAGT